MSTTLHPALRLSLPLPRTPPGARTPFDSHPTPPPALSPTCSARAYTALHPPLHAHALTAPPLLTQMDPKFLRNQRFSKKWMGKGREASE